MDHTPLQRRRRSGDAMEGAVMTIDADRAHAKAQRSGAVGRLHVEEWGAGERVVLVHGSLATGAEEWEVQRPLGDEGFRLVVFDRRGYGQSPFATGEDFLADADDIVELIGDGAHLVGHSYGGLGAMIAAARRPDATKSLTLLEAPALVSAEAAPAWRAFVEEIVVLWGQDLPDEEWVVRFLTAVGSDPDQFPPEMLALAVPLVPVFRQGRPFFDAELPLDEVAAAPFPKLVASGGHHEGFDQMCASLARRIGASQAVVVGAGHEIQFTGDPINKALQSLWHSVTAESS
jgi:pimeloyl-ACP methyl ester carboxylesterase